MIAIITFKGGQPKQLLLGITALPFTKQPNVLAPVWVMGGSFASSASRLSVFLQQVIKARAVAINK
jgi:hypothetical protein